VTGSGAQLRVRMQSGRVHGLFVKLADRAVIEMARSAFDFVVVDREHSQLSEHDALALIAHGAAAELPVLLRLHELDGGQVNRALEAGAAGIQLSSVRDADAVNALRASCEYPPRGRRSISLAHAGGGHGATSIADYLAGSAGVALVVAQIESALAPSAYASILAAKPDVAFVGTTDLLVDCGLDAERSARHVEQIATAAREADVVLGGFALAERDDVRYLIDASDVSLLSLGIRAAAQTNHIEEAADEG
jgi:2-keto-3-deoxy-L-rhamnonate aldolase RhmA